MRPAGQRWLTAALCALVLLLVLARSARGAGDLVVVIAYPDDLRGSFSVFALAAAPAAAARLAGRARGGARPRSPRAPRTTWCRGRRSSAGIAPGKYWVTVDGELFGGASEERARGAVRVSARDGRSRDTHRVEFDLKPRHCPVEIRVALGGPAGARVRGLGRGPAGHVPPPARPVRAHRPAARPASRGAGQRRSRRGARGARRELRDLGDRRRPRPHRGRAVQGLPAGSDSVPPGRRPDRCARARARGPGQALELPARAHARGAGQQGPRRRALRVRGVFRRTPRSCARSSSEWSRAAALYQKAGEPMRSADMFRRAGDPIRAGKAYEAAADYERALACYREARRDGARDRRAGAQR